MLIKTYYPDKSKSIDSNKKSVKIITAYKHLKNLAIDTTIDSDEIKVAKKIFEEDEDMFSFWDTCPDCSGERKNRHHSIWTKKTCPDCEPLPVGINIFGGWYKNVKKSSGYKALRCKYCKGSGKFIQRSGRTVDCYACKGTGIWKTITCKTCKGWGFIFTEIEDVVTCSTCNGLGKVKIDLFNPVIRKGSILI